MQEISIRFTNTDLYGLWWESGLTGDCVLFAGANLGTGWGGIKPLTILGDWDTRYETPG